MIFFEAINRSADQQRQDALLENSVSEEAVDIEFKGFARERCAQFFKKYSPHRLSPSFLKDIARIVCVGVGARSQDPLRRDLFNQVTSRSQDPLRRDLVNREHIRLISLAGVRGKGLSQGSTPFHVEVRYRMGKGSHKLLERSPYPNGPETFRVGFNNQVNSSHPYPVTLVVIHPTFNLPCTCQLGLRSVTAA
ncbi:hypothetical protein L0F63_000082 [Massospora cicadina]|nr:hypothetical protein L0F63_000082 [Massospora cicadina]